MLLLEVTILEQQVNSMYILARRTPKLEIRRIFHIIKRLKFLKNPPSWRTGGGKWWEIQDEVGDFLQVGISRNKNIQMTEPLRKRGTYFIQ